MTWKVIPRCLWHFLRSNSVRLFSKLIWQQPKTPGIHARMALCHLKCKSGVQKLWLNLAWHSTNLWLLLGMRDVIVEPFQVLFHLKPSSPFQSRKLTLFLDVGPDSSWIGNPLDLIEWYTFTQGHIENILCMWTCSARSAPLQAVKWDSVGHSSGVLNRACYPGQVQLQLSSERPATSELFWLLTGCQGHVKEAIFEGCLQILHSTLSPPWLWRDPLLFY